MILRRLGRLLTLSLAVFCLVVLFRSPLVVVIPVIGNRDSAPLKPVSRVAKATVATNTLNNSIIHQALRTHRVQNEMHGYIHHITAEELVSDLSEHDKQKRPRGAWSKPAYLLGLIVSELTKAENERLQWIFWFDADTIVLNPHTPLEIFLPPESIPELKDINLLMGSNWDGLNSGVFALRVHPWSVSALSTILAYPIYEATRSNTDRFRDQSAFQWFLQPNLYSPLFKLPNRGKEYWAEVPIRWFNALPINNPFSKKYDWVFTNNMTGDLFDHGTDKVYDDGRGGLVRPWKVMQGDMVVHFAGANTVRDSWMGPWLERAEAYLPEWSNAGKQVELKRETQSFWEDIAKRISRERETAEKKAAPESTVQSKDQPEKLLTDPAVKTTAVVTGDVQPAGQRFASDGPRFEPIIEKKIHLD